MNTIPRMDDSLICRLLNVRIIGSGRLPKEDLQTIDDAIEAIKTVTQASEVEKFMDAAGLCKRCAAPIAGVPVDMVLHCPACGMQHVDAPDERTPGWVNESHRSHLCHGCGHIWRPADVPTNGVAAIKTKGKADSPVDEVKRPAELACGPDYKHMFLEAVQALANIDKLLGLPEDGCNDPQVTVSALADFLAGAREAAQFRDHWVDAQYQSEPQPVQPRERAPSSFVNAAGIHASDTPAQVVRKLDAAFHDAVTFKESDAEVAQPMTQAQREAVISAAENALDSDINLSWRHALINEVERHHGIVASQKPKD